MNILGITQRYFPVIGGSEILAKNFLDYMAKKHNITVYTTNANKIDSFWNAGLEKITDSEKMSYDVVRCDFLTPEEIKYEKNLEKLEFITNFPGPFSPQIKKIKKVNSICHQQTIYKIEICIETVR